MYHFSAPSTSLNPSLLLLLPRRAEAFGIGMLLGGPRVVEYALDVLCDADEAAFATAAVVDVDDAEAVV